MRRQRVSVHIRVFGYATNETPELMPMPIALAHRLSYQLAQVRKLGLLPHLGPDGRAQVTVRYRDGVPVAVEKVIIVTQHQAGAEDRMEADLWHSVVLDVLPAGRYDAAGLRRSFFANPAGRFVTGGPGGDTGLTGRQIVVDTYGGFARHGGGAFSGQDPSKVGRSAAYGHFGRDDADFTWEATDKAGVLRAAAGLPEPAAVG